VTKPDLIDYRFEGVQISLCTLYTCTRCSRLFLHEGQQHTVLRILRSIHVCALLSWKYGIWCGMQLCALCTSKIQCI